MSRFERLLIPIIAVVMAAAFLLEAADPAAVRIGAIAIGLLLVACLLVGMVHRARKKLREARTARPPDQTSNDALGG
jgi:hypothetical protein